MVDGESLPPSKKRVAGREISRDDPGLDADDDAPEEEMGTFKLASEEVLATRRIVKIRRNTPASLAASNPFAAVCLVPQHTDSSAVTDGVSAAKPSDVSSATHASHVEGFSEEVGGTDEPENTHEDKLPSESTEDLVSKSEAIGKDSEGTFGDSAEESNGTTNNEKSHTEPDDPLKEAAGKPQGESGVDLTDPEVGDNAKDDSLDDLTVPNSKVVDEAKGDSGEDVTASNPKAIDEAMGDSGQDVTVPHSTPKDETVASEEQAASKEGEVNGDGSTKGTASAVNSFQQLSGSQNAFTGLAGTGFSNPSFSFGTIPTKDGSFSFSTSGFGSGSSSIFGLKSSSTSLFGTGDSNNRSSTEGFGIPAADSGEPTGNSQPAMQEVPVETGEENEKVAFVVDAALFEFLDGGWKERGKGELKLNVTTDSGEKGRLVMRAKGNYRLILNASLYADMKLTNMEKKGITFACINSASEGKSNTLATFALKFKESSIVDAFRAAVMDHKGKKPAVLNTPENSPKASDD